MWTFVQTSYQMAISCFFGLPAASALVILVKAIELVAEDWVGTGTSTEDITGANEITSFVENLIEAIVLSPCAILIQRRIILHEVSSNYLTAAMSLRFVRFVGAALLLVFANVVAYHALRLSQSSNNWSMLIGMICVVAFVILFLRIFLAFPAIATDGSSTPFSDSFRDTRGSSWWLLFLFVLTAIPIVLFEIGLDHFLGASSEYASMWWLGVSAMTLLRAFSFAVIVTLASYLYATRSGWRMTSPAVPVSAPAARTRLIVRVIATLVVVLAAYVIYRVPSLLVPLLFGPQSVSFSAYIALQVLAWFTLRKPLWFWALVPLPFMLAVAFITVRAYLHQSNMWPILMIFTTPWAVLWVAIIEVLGLWAQAHPRRRALTLLTFGIVLASFLL